MTESFYQMTCELQGAGTKPDIVRRSQGLYSRLTDYFENRRFSRTMAVLTPFVDSLGIVILANLDPSKEGYYQAGGIAAAAAIVYPIMTLALHIATKRAKRDIEREFGEGTVTPENYKKLSQMLQNYER